MITFAENFTKMTTKNRTLHPLTNETDIIDKLGLVVFDNVRQMPTYGEPFTTPYTVIVLNLQGWLKTECNTRPVVFRKHDIAVLSPNNILCAHESSDDYKAMLIAISPTFQDEVKRRHPATYRDSYHYYYRQDIPLTDKQFNTVHSIFLLLQSVSHSDCSHRWEMLGNLLEVLSLLLQDYRHENGIADHSPSPREELFINFHQAIVAHFRESREVKFYADMFHLSPRHFATVIKKQTNVNALDWISNYVIIQAKSALARFDVSIQQVAYALGFPDQATFSRYFKHNTGLSPKEFREQKITW